LRTGDRRENLLDMNKRIKKLFTTTQADG